MLAPCVPERSLPAFATGGRLRIVTVAVSELVAPLLSVTVSVAV
jgi:hypothetical protein